MINNALAIVLYGITICNCVTAYLQERQVTIPAIIQSFGAEEPVQSFATLEDFPHFITP
jgi:hypothetical protein